MKYNISVIETIGFTVDIEAETKQDAKNKVKEMYNANKNLGKDRQELLETEFISEWNNCFIAENNKNKRKKRLVLTV